MYLVAFQLRIKQPHITHLSINREEEFKALEKRNFIESVQRWLCGSHTLSALQIMCVSKVSMGSLEMVNHTTQLIIGGEAKFHGLIHISARIGPTSIYHHG